MQKPNTALRGLSIVHLTMLIMQLLFAIIAIIVVANGIVKPSQNELDSMLQVIAIALAASGFFIGTRRFKKMMQEIRESGTSSAQQKFDKYRTASILLWAMIEGPCLFCIISFILTGNYAFIALAAVLIFLFFIFGPNRQKLSMFLGLSEYEIDNLK